MWVKIVTHVHPGLGLLGEADGVTPHTPCHWEGVWVWKAAGHLSEHGEGQSGILGEPAGPGS